MAEDHRAGSRGLGGRVRGVALAACLALPAMTVVPIIAPGTNPALAQAQPTATAPAASTPRPPAQAAPSAGPTLPLPADMTLQEYQGLNCIAFGLTAAAGVYVYSDVIVEVLTGMSVNAYLLLPVLATGFAAGCSVGSTMSPGLLWIYSRF